MGITLTQVPQNNNTGESTDPLGYETESDGVKFFWGPGQRRSFTDEATGQQHSISNVAAAPAGGVLEDNELSKKKNPSDQSRS